MESAHANRAWQHAYAGLSVAASPEMQRDDPLLQKNIEGFDEGYRVDIKTEASKLNINRVLETQDRTLLENLFRAWGVNNAQADDLIGALIDWVDRDELVDLNGAEEDYYESQGFVDRPYNRPFYNLNEMTLVRGFSEIERLQPQWREYFTLYSEGLLDIYEARPDLVAVAAEVGVEEVIDMQNLARGDDGVFRTEDDQKYGSLEEVLNTLVSPTERREIIAPRFTVQGQTLRIESVGFSGTYSYQINAVLRGQGGLLHYEEEKIYSE